MQKETILKKIKVLLGLAKDEMASVKLNDGTEVFYNKLEVGESLYDAEGNIVPAGDYTLEDKRTVKIDDTGVIASIEEPTEPAEPEQPEPTEPTEPETEVKAEEETPTEQTERTLGERVADLEVAVNDIYEAVLAITEQLKMNETKVDETVESFKAFKSQPAAQPLEFNVEKEDKKMSRFEKLKALK